MSAFLVDRQHVAYIVSAATSPQIRGRYGDRVRWRHDGKAHELAAGDAERFAEVATMLWRENVRSVEGRYPDCVGKPERMPGPRMGPGERFEITPREYLVNLHAHPAQLLGAIHCLQYQSCEHEGWTTSEAKAFLDSLANDCGRRCADRLASIERVGVPWEVTNARKMPAYEAEAAYTGD